VRAHGDVVLVEVVAAALEDEEPARLGDHVGGVADHEVAVAGRG
jgi:VIT1/CCC1 family predicted Fe2+/Mn2+ transporter